MAPLRQIFEMTAGADADALLATPDLTYVVELLRRSGETLSVDVLEQLLRHVVPGEHKIIDGTGDLVR